MGSLLLCPFNRIIVYIEFFFRAYDLDRLGFAMVNSVRPEFYYLGIMSLSTKFCQVIKNSDCSLLSLQ